MKQILYKLFEHRYLGRTEARDILQNIVQGKYNDAQIASLITVFLMRNISVEELTGFRDALLEMRIPVDLSEYTPNVMEQHGVQFTSDMSRLRKSMDMCNIAYLHAPLFNSAMKAVAPVRKALGVRTFFNMLGPLVNPALPKYQLLGVYNLPLLRLYNYVFQESDTRFAVVHGLDGYDEISLTGEFKVATSTTETIYTPESIGFNRYCEQDLDGGKSPDEAARIFDRVLQGEATPAQTDCVIANAAFAIRVIEPEKSLADCIALARESMESGRALKTLKMFVELNS